MSDATVVVESPAKGGSIITANLAFNYNRSVMAFPGNIYSETSKGCNNLIKQNKAMLINSAQDLLLELGWEQKDDDGKSKKNIQRQLFVDLSDEEKKILEIIEREKKPSIDIISVETEIPMTQTSSILLSLELNGIVVSLPGKKYKLA
jgi:DNA processing protein